MKIGVRTLFQYILLVAIPLLGVLGSLWAGADLTAPASVGGAWSLEIAKQPAQACPAFAGWEGQVHMAISQSGPELLIVFTDASRTLMSGSLSGLSIAAETTDSATTKLVLSAEVDRQSTPQRISVSLQADDCTGSLDFSGILQPHNITGQEH